MIKNIILDIGNVILDFKPNDYFYKHWDDKDVIDRCMKALFLHNDWNQYDLGYTTLKEIKENAKQLEPLLSNEIDDMMDMWVDIISIMPFYERIKEFQLKGYKVYLLSNLNKDSDEYIEDKFDLYDIVDGLIISHRVHKIKPNLDIYEHLCNTYDLNINECIFIDDKKENVDAAKQLGMEAILYTTLEETEKELMKYVK